MDATAPAILELGALLLVAALAGWVARKAGLPAVIGYLAVGVAISPFTPGYVADRGQLQLLADVGVVVLLFEVGIEVDVGRLRRDHSALAWAAPFQVLVTTGVSAVVFFALGIEPIGAALMGLCIAFSSSVVVVNITRSRRRTTDRATEEGMLGWSVLQDISAVALAAVLLALLGAESRPVEIALPLLVGFGLCAVIAAWLLPRCSVRCEPSTTCSSSSRWPADSP
ncbi:MAG TPA: cation:proton antiporter [Candidatus Limnocylindrales bacterium]|nr:cation:proton antiporter [Candidatus Limnocylindrales bacterium]